MTNLIEVLDKIAKANSLDAVVVEGYDGVGKGRVLNTLSQYYGTTPYRPDYNLWQEFDHRNVDRWKISGFFWDVYSHFNITNTNHILLFDRGVISGAVYNNDMRIALRYKELLRDKRVMHILVCCTHDDYMKFLNVRFNNLDDDDREELWKECEVYTERYTKALDLSGVDYMIYYNHFVEGEAERLSKVCEGCGHYSYGWCRHPRVNSTVSPSKERCDLSRDKEVQD